jgi:isoleucyl-tRNA synthetase
MSAMLEKKAPFKTLLGHALVKDENGREMHKSWGNAIWFEDAAEKMGVDVMRWLYASQNPEHNLLFGYSIADEVRKSLITLWNTYYFFVTYANLDNFDPHSVDVEDSDYTILDNWISSKMNEFINDSKSHYEKFEVYKLMKNASLILDNLSNWYVRRNRRRFWKSESDNDKNAAYLTLYNALITYVKVLAPIIPFLTEEIYKNLSGSDSSIHLSNFPDYDKNKTDFNLINEIDDVISIVNLSRSIRNKSNIKTRQPLSKIYIYSDKDISDSIKRNESQIKDELNIKSIEICDNANDILDYEVKPNFALLSSKYSKEMKDIVSSIKNMDANQLVEEINKNKKFIININGDDIEILDNEVLINELPKNNLCTNSNRNFVIGLDTVITKELKMEGILRDLIRHVQNFRKDSKLEVSDRIIFSILASDEVISSVNKFEDYFKNETLTDSIINDLDNMDYRVKFKINNEDVEIGISKV